MRRHLIIALTLLVAAAVSAQSPREMFERARMLEESNNRLSDAIVLYTQVASQSADRQLAATAQLRIGLLHERLGRKDDAARTFAALARDYSDQPQLAERARARLASLSAVQAAGAPITSRIVWAGPNVDTQGAVSPDGRYISYVQRGSGQLAVYNIAARTSARLTDIRHSGEQLAMESRFSPDSRRVAFVWMGGDRVAELRLAAIGRRGSTVVYRNPEVVPDPFGWSPDGRHVFAVLEGRTGSIQIAEIPVAGGAIRVLKTFDWRFPDASVSPDGRWIAYAIRSSDGSAKGDLFLLAVDGSREVSLDRHPADDASPVWTPDGSGVVFVSDRAGVLDLWLVSVADGQPLGSARMVKRNVGRGRPLGFAADGRLFYASGKSSVDVYVGSIDPASARATPGILPISERFVGSNFAPDWSPDGTRLLYVSQRSAAGGGGAGFTIVVRSMADGREHDLTPRLQYFHRPRWAPDGKTIVVQGKGLTGPAGLFAIDANDGSVSTLVRGDGEGGAAHQAWSRDGSTLFFSHIFSVSSRVVARDIASGAERELHRPGGGEKAVAPDGAWLAALFHVVGQPTAIRLIPTAGGAPRDLLAIAPPDRIQYFGGLSWTSDGKALLFVKESGGRRELCRVDVETGRVTGTGLAPTGLTYVRLHPDGRQIAYSAGTREEEVWVIENFLPSRNVTSR
jgi:Tol biopolymer transport system component